MNGALSFRKKKKTGRFKRKKRVNAYYA
jgi:hypothetical protein